MVKVIDFFSVTKSLALVIIIISGFVWLGEGKTENLTNLFDNTSDSPGNYALAFYAVLTHSISSSRLRQAVPLILGSGSMKHTPAAFFQLRERKKSLEKSFECFKFR